MVLNLKEYDDATTSTGRGEIPASELRFAANRILESVGTPLEPSGRDRSLFLDDDPEREDDSTGRIGNDTTEAALHGDGILSLGEI